MKATLALVETWEARLLSGTAMSRPHSRIEHRYGVRCPQLDQMAVDRGLEGINGIAESLKRHLEPIIRPCPAASHRNEPGGGIDARSIVSRRVDRTLEETGHGWWKKMEGRE